MGRTVARTVFVSNPETGEALLLVAGDEAPDWAVDVVSNPRVWGDDDDGSGDAPAADDTGGDTGGDDESGDADAGSVYDAFTVADLRDEIRGRNEGREPDQRVSLDGNKADLVAALEADDAAQG